MSETVKVVVTLDNGALTIDPLRAGVDPGDEVEWEFRGSDAESMTVTPKQPGNWICDDNPPRYTASKKNGKAKTGRVRGNAPKGIYRYDIEFSFGGSGGQSIKIDPEIILPRPRL